MEDVIVRAFYFETHKIAGEALASNIKCKS